MNKREQFYFWLGLLFGVMLIVSAVGGGYLAARTTQVEPVQALDFYTPYPESAMPSKAIGLYPNDCALVGGFDAEVIVCFYPEVSPKVVNVPRQRAEKPVDDSVVVVEPPAHDPPAEEQPTPDVKPGYGYGDKNHEHSGPPGLANKPDKGNNGKGKGGK